MMINSSKLKERITGIQEKIGEENQAKNCNKREPLWKSLISSSKGQFVYTRNQELISDYLQIRRDSYHNDKYMRGHFNHGESDIYDYKSDILLVCINSEVIGGARLTYTTPDKPLVLPTECNNFTFKKTFPEYPLDRVDYGEVHRLVVIPQFRGKDQNYARQLLLRLYARAVELGLKYIFVPSIPLRCRLYRKLLYSLNLDLIIRKDILLESPKYDNVLMYLTVLEVETQAIFSDIKEIVSDSQTRAKLYQLDYEISVVEKS